MSDEVKLCMRGDELIGSECAAPQPADPSRRPEPIRVWVRETYGTLAGLWCSVAGPMEKALAEYRTPSEAGWRGGDEGVLVSAAAWEEVLGLAAEANASRQLFAESERFAQFCLDSGFGDQWLMDDVHLEEAWAKYKAREGANAPAPE